MPEIIRTHDPRVQKPSLWARFAKLAGAIAVIAGVFVGINSMLKVMEEWKPVPIEPQLRIGWLTVDDPKNLECVIKPGDTFKLQKDGPAVALAANECYTQLKAAMEQPPQAPQPLGKSYFLYIENTGDAIETLTIYERAASAGARDIHRSLEKGAAIARCMGYEGRSGLLKSRMEPFDEIGVLRSNGRLSVVAIPGRDIGVRRGATDCGGVAWNYPD